MSDAIVIGAGAIGLALALELRERGLSVTVLERGEIGREASWAAAGMLSPRDPHTPPALLEIASYSAELYPEFVRYLEEVSGEATGYSQAGALVITQNAEGHELCREEVTTLEPGLAMDSGHVQYIEEASVDPRALLLALSSTCHRRGVIVHHEHEVMELLSEDGAVQGVRCKAKVFFACVVINCAGAWAQQLAPGAAKIPVVPVRGQMLAVVGRRGSISHTIRTKDIYFLPRADGRIVIGSTLEHVGFDKRVEPEVILCMRRSAAALFPAIAEMRIAETWAGLRPGTPDDLPILGKVPELTGYYVAAGHYRNGILLAPATARLLAQTIVGDKVELELAAFSPKRLLR